MIVRLLVALGVALFCLVSVPAFADGEGGIEALRQSLAEAESEFLTLRGDYEKLLEFRGKVEGYRDALQERLSAMEPRRAELRTEEVQLGTPRPGESEPPAIAERRRVLAEALRTYEAEHAPVVLAYRQADRLWAKTVEARRELFSRRIFSHESSLLNPAFWAAILTEEGPDLAARTRALALEWHYHVEAADIRGMVLALFLGAALTLGLFVWLHRTITRRRIAAEVEASGLPPQQKAAARGLLVLAMRSVPLAAAMLLFCVMFERIDAGPEEVAQFLRSIALGLFASGVARGAAGALLAPRAPVWRVLKTSDRKAAIVASGIVRAADFYTIGIVATGYQKMVEMRIPGEIATIMLVTLAMVVDGFIVLRRLQEEDASPVRGFVSVNFAWARPVLALTCAACTGALLLGYVALAGFLSSRATVTATVVTAATFVVTALNELVDRQAPSGTRFGHILSRTLGIEGRALDVVATSLSGLIRFVVIAGTAIVVLTPWGFRYGDLNPMEDLATFMAITDIRGWLGSFGLGIVAFVVGIGATRLVVGWLDGALLPRTSLDESLRHSVRTILGYAGFLATALVALSLMGVNAQNVAVVAGALSVGIGFGLQSVVSNFISGLIVLAERPIRVGDIVVVKGEEGRVQRISVRSTLISTFERSSLIVPNADLITSVIRNRTLSDATQQLRFTLLIDHDADPARAHEMLLSIAYHHPNVLKDPMPVIVFQRIIEAGQEFEIRCNVDSLDNMVSVRSDLHHQIVQIFRAERIGFARSDGGPDHSPGPARPRPAQLPAPT